MSNAIFINQIGYLTNGFKAGYVSETTAQSAGKSAAFEIKSLDNQVVYTGTLSAPKEDRIAGAPYCCADFSDFTQPGQYTLWVGCNSSYVFTIGDGIFTPLYKSILNYFALSRCGCKVEDKVFGHVPCHTIEAEVYGEPGKTKKVTGGWHDAGDYGRYVVSVTKTVLDLLLSYESLKNKGAAGAESLKLFDILSEVRFGLDWLLQMQREDGGVYHKISCYRFCGFIVPEMEKEVQVLAPVSTAATADFAGCAAYSSIYFREIDGAFADKLVAAAEKAQSYIDTHEEELYKNPPEIRTGEYGDRNVKDERFLALAGLYAATGKDEYKTAAQKIWDEVHNVKCEGTICDTKKFFSGFGWGSVGGYGMEIFLKSGKLSEEDSFAAEIKASVYDRANHLLEKVNNASFGSCHEFVFWGSNGNVCDNAHYLILASDFCQDEEKKNEYLVAAKKQFDYILGCNPMGLCYVTGNGTDSPKNPHHRPSGALKSLMPGMLAGGPAEGLVDPTIKEAYADKNIPPLCCYLDNVQSYSSNEVAIYWNSPFVLLCARFM